MKQVTTFVGIDAHKKDLFVAMLIGSASTPVTWQAELVDADLIVTGDPHLLKLRRCGRAGIVKVSTFLRILGDGGARRP